MGKNYELEAEITIKMTVNRRADNLWDAIEQVHDNILNGEYKLSFRDITDLKVNEK